jgi:hypothetical protein
MPNEFFAHCIAFGHGINTCTRGGRASGRSTDPIYAPLPVSLQETRCMAMSMRQVQRIQWIVWNMYKECKKKKLTKTCLLTPPPPSVWTWRDVQDVPKIFKQCCRKTLSEDICKLPRRCYVQYLDFTKIDLLLTKWRSILTCFVR